MLCDLLLSGFGVRLGESYKSASIVARVTTEGRQRAKDTYGADAVWIDEAGQVDPGNMDGIEGAAEELRDAQGCVMGRQQLLLSLDLSQNLPVKPGAERSDLSLKRLIFESEVFLLGRFWLVVRMKVYSCSKL